MYWIAFSLLPLKLYAWPCKCILEIHSWLQRKMVYVICELTWFFQKQKSTTIGTILCKLVVYLSAVTKNTSKLLNNYLTGYIYTNQFRIMSGNIFCFWKIYVNICVLYQPCLYTFLLESTIVMTVWFFHLCFRKLNNLLKTKVPYNFCGFLKAWPKFYSYVLF